MEVVIKRLVAVSLNVSAGKADYLEVGDPYDRCFFAVTMVGRQSENTFLVTGNIRHFPAVPFVVTPARFVGILQNSRQS